MPDVSHTRKGWAAAAMRERTAEHLDNSLARPLP